MKLFCQLANDDFMALRITAPSEKEASVLWKRELLLSLILKKFQQLGFKLQSSSINSLIVTEIENNLYK